MKPHGTPFLTSIFIPTTTIETLNATFLQVFNYDETVKSPNLTQCVIPAKAGIQLYQIHLVPGSSPG